MGRLTYKNYIEEYEVNFEKMYKQDAIRQIDNQIKKLKGEE